MRESPALSLARALIDAGRKVLIYEPEIDLERLVGANLHYLEARLPEYKKCFVSWLTLLAEADMLAVSRPGVLPAMEPATDRATVIRLYQLADY